MNSQIMKYLFPVMLLLPLQLLAHHSVAEFDIEKDITIQATVTEVWFNNPHVRFYATETGSDGKVVEWDLHTSSPNSLIRNGWYGDAIKAGDKVTFIGNPTRSGEPRMLIHTVELADGRVLSTRR